MILMDTERFEALIDAILAIIVTLIILEIPIPAHPDFASLWEVRIEFLAYLVSFFIVFNIWNSHHNLFIRINKLNSTIVWTSLAGIFILSFIPYFTTMVSEQFNSFFAQACFGSIFILLHIHYVIQAEIIKRTDPSNVALIIYLDKGEHNSLFEFILFTISYILGYFVYPPLIMVGCLIAMSYWIISDQYLTD